MADDLAANTRPQVRPNRVKQRFERREIALAAWADFADPMIVEIIALAGLDAVAINLEHSTFDLDLVRQMIITADAAGISSIVRVPAGAWDTALRVLDAGAQGIQISHVCDVETAVQAVDATRYAPLGHRGAFGVGRAARYGAVPWNEYAAAANEQVLLTLQIEDREAIEHIEEIAAVPGVDLLNVGGADLAESLELPANHPDLRAALTDLAARVRAVGNARLGFAIGHPFLTLTVEELRDLGVAYANVAPHPEVILRRALTEKVAAIRAAWSAVG
jgi:2-keto-3-deoxy-L-rhamnonate aldolase RhmA